MAIQGMNEPGTYLITTGYGRDAKTTSVDADYLDYDGPDGELQAHKDGTVVATFRYWESILKKKD